MHLGSTCLQETRSRKRLTGSGSRSERAKSCAACTSAGAPLRGRRGRSCRSPSMGPMFGRAASTQASESDTCSGKCVSSKKDSLPRTLVLQKICARPRLAAYSRFARSPMCLSGTARRSKLKAGAALRLRTRCRSSSSRMMVYGPKLDSALTQSAGNGPWHERASAGSFGRRSRARRRSSFDLQMRRVSFRERKSPLPSPASEMSSEPQFSRLCPWRLASRWACGSARSRFGRRSEARPGCAARRAGRGRRGRRSRCRARDSS